VKLTRRSLLLGAAAAAQSRSASFSLSRQIAESIFVSAKPYKDPFNEVELDGSGASWGLRDKKSSLPVSI
jgi:hypothetical protein